MDNIVKKLNESRISRALNEANYGGAFDILPNQLFTRDDLYDFATEVVDQLHSNYHVDVELLDIDMTNKVLSMSVSYKDYEFSYSVRVDLRKVHNYHLIGSYAEEFCQSIGSQIEQENL